MTSEKGENERMSKNIQSFEKAFWAINPWIANLNFTLPDMP